MSITLESVLTVTGLSLVVGILIQIVRQWITETRLLNLVAFVLALVIAELGTWISSGLTWQQAFEAFLLALAATGGTTFAVETGKNIAGLLGSGSRSDDSRLAQAVTTVLSDETGKELVKEVLKKTT
jgi:TRAP-type C4-dicarboxylate transport system permease large subunit